MDQPKVLLAKSPRDPANPQRAETLVGHMDNVARVSEAMMATVGVAALHSTGLEESMFEELRQAVLRSACLHDFGKANTQFQRALERGKHPPQALRHECIGTWLLLANPDMDEWLFEGCSQRVRWAALFAVLGHHLKVRDGQSLEARDGSGDARIGVFCDHADFCSCLTATARLLGLDSVPPAMPRREIDLLTSPQLPELHLWILDATEWFEQADPDTRRFVALAKALMIAADVAGSAVPKTGIDPAEWTEDVLCRVCRSEELNDIALSRLQGQRRRDFQERVAASEANVTFVKAGCGTGKTIAAYLWASQRAAGRKLFFCYPTTGTATEGFRDYVIPAELPPDARLLHSRSECDLEYLLESPEDGEVQNAMRIESLGAWDVPLVLCTVDQVLWLIQNGRRALFSSPALLNGAFVFDEIHQYDDRLFSSLLRFIDAFPGAPILLMTASLPASRLKALRKALEGRGQPLRMIEGPPELELIPRYIVDGLRDEPPWSMVDEAIGVGEKVLWVANTVDRCTGFAAEAERRGYAPIIYHSRYRYLDRIDRHNTVIEAFRTPGHALAVTTQVCEVSLDLSADLLITDLAPAPALIQRMGRLNRRMTPGDGRGPRPAVILNVGTPHPYEPGNLAVAREWLRALGPGPHSQAALAAAFEDIAQGEEPHAGRSEWLDGGPFAVGAPLREAGATVPVVRAEDEPMCVDSRRSPIMREITRYAIPMPLWPVTAEIGTWRRLGFAFVAPVGRIKYSDEWGATWRRE